MCLTEHLAVALVGAPALAPRQHMVGTHVSEVPYLNLVGIVAYGAQRTVACVLGLGFGSLAAVDTAL